MAESSHRRRCSCAERAYPKRQFQPTHHLDLPPGLPAAPLQLTVCKGAVAAKCCTGRYLALAQEVDAKAEAEAEAEAKVEVDEDLPILAETDDTADATDSTAGLGNGVRQRARTAGTAGPSPNSPNASPGGRRLRANSIAPGDDAEAEGGSADGVSLQVGFKSADELAVGCDPATDICEEAAAVLEEAATTCSVRTRGWQGLALRGASAALGRAGRLPAGSPHALLRLLPAAFHPRLPPPASLHVTVPREKKALHPWLSW